MPTDTTNAPPALSTERREKVVILSIRVMTASLNRSLRLRA